MKEDLLQYFWRTHSWKDREFETTDGRLVQIISAGQLNRDAGPDFSNARIRIGHELWAGNVEIHVRSSEWYAHKHQYDPAYKTVVLHVVWEEDQPVFHDADVRIPCFELKNIISQDIIDNYQRLMNNAFWIPCENQVSKFDMFRGFLGMNAKLVEKFEDKTEVLEHIYTRSGADWNETLHRFLARGFGLNVNSTAFELLAEKLTWALSEKYKNQPQILEAIAFHASGLLSNASGNYPDELTSHYDKISAEDKTEALAEGAFMFFRTRPSNFPTLRIAQWVRLLCSDKSLLDLIQNMHSPEEFTSLVCRPLEGFWQEHFTFNVRSKGFPTHAGREFAKLLLINAIAPFLFFYGKKLGNLEIQQKAIDMLDEMKAENNSIIRKFRQLGFPVKTASQSQAFLLLKKKYCEQRQCLDCPFGMQIFKE